MAGAQAVTNGDDNEVYGRCTVLYGNQELGRCAVTHADHAVIMRDVIRGFTHEKSLPGRDMGLPTICYHDPRIQSTAQMTRVAGRSEE